MEVPEEIYGQILNKLSLSEAIKVAKSGSKLAKAALLYYPWNLSRRGVCNAFDKSHLNLMLKNTHIDRYGLLMCSISAKDEFLALKILSIAKNNPEKKEYKVNVHQGSDFVIIKASSEGLVNLVRVLLENYNLNPSVNKNLAFKVAFKNKHKDVVNLLLESPKFDYEDFSIIYLVIEDEDEDVLIKIVERAKYKDKVTRGRYINVIFKEAIRDGMMSLVTYMINNEKVSTDHMGFIIGDFIKDPAAISKTRKTIKILVNKYRNGSVAPEGDYYNSDVYPQFILDTIEKSIYNLSMFKMMMEETKINPGYNDSTLLGLVSTFDGLIYAYPVAKYLLTKYKDQVDPSAMNFGVFWNLSFNRHISSSARNLFDLVIDHPRIKYNPQLHALLLSKIYKSK